MREDELSWKLLTAYLLVIAMSAVLFHEGHRPEIAAMPCFLLAMLMRRWPAS
jgi:hypothetical protein